MMGNQYVMPHFLYLYCSCHHQIRVPKPIMEIQKRLFRLLFSLLSMLPGQRILISLSSYHSDNFNKLQEMKVCPECGNAIPHNGSFTLKKHYPRRSYT